jgi:hypothetical protein
MFIALDDELPLEQRILEPEPEERGTVDVDFPAAGRWAARVILTGVSGGRWTELEPFTLGDHHLGMTVELGTSRPEPPHDWIGRERDD